MKKLLTLLLVCLLVLGLGACNSKEDSTALSTNETQEQTTTQEQTKEDEQELIIEEAKQEEVVVEETKEEIKEETKKEIDPEVLKTYKYWVVFYDHEGNELQREAIKYGTVPTYWSDIPYYDDGTYWYKGVGWTDKWGREIKEFKPITGNTKFYAIYEKSGEVSHSSGGGGDNPPGPPPYVPNCTETSTLVKIIEHKWMIGSWQGYRFIIYTYNSVSGQFEESRTIPSGSYKTICGSVDYAGIEQDHYYHATIGWNDTISWIGPECMTPGPDHGISVN